MQRIGWLTGLCAAGALHAQSMMAPGMSGRGLPGVTRPMLNAGPAIGGMGGVIVNPNWIGAAAMFAPHLLMGNGMAGNGMGFIGAPTAPVQPVPPVGIGTLPVGQVSRAPVVVASVSPVQDLRTVDERLLAFQREQAKAGSPSAQRALSKRYAEGLGVEKSALLAKAWADAAERSERRAASGDGLNP